MKKLRYGVIGLKGIGKRHFQTVREHEQCTLVALADINEPLVTKFAQELGLRSYTNYRDMLEKEYLDVVSIATPHDLHGPIGLDCLNAGAHVLMEKPLATRVSEADRLIEVAKQNKLKLGVCHQYRTFRASQALKHMIDSGAIGNIMRVLWTWGLLRWQGYYDQDPWRGTFRHAGGGILMSQASHEIDLICWLIGKPVRVAALVGNQLHNTEVEDVAGAEVLFSSGAVGSFQFSLNQPKGYSVRQIAGDRGVLVMSDVKSLCGDENDQILLGTYVGAVPETVTRFTSSRDESTIFWKTINLDSDESSPKGLLNRGFLWGGKRSVKQQKRPHPLDQLVNNFINAVVTGDEPLVTGESAHATIEVINAIYLSALRKKTVDLPIDRAEYDQLFEELVSGKVGVPRYR